MVRLAALWQRAGLYAGLDEVGGVGRRRRPRRQFYSLGGAQPDSWHSVQVAYVNGWPFFSPTTGQVVRTVVSGSTYVLSALPQLAQVVESVLFSQ